LRLSFALADRRRLLAHVIRYIGHLHGGTGLSVFGNIPNLFQHVGWASTARFKEKVHGRARFTSKTFTWMSLAQVETAIRDETI
jgi:hypothetical protein